MDRFDIVRAWFWYLEQTHAGQFSAKYAALSRIGTYFTPSILDSASRIETEDSEAGNYYRDLLFRNPEPRDRS